MSEVENLQTSVADSHKAIIILAYEIDVHSFLFLRSMNQQL